MSLGRKIREFREKRGLSQTQLAKIIGTAQTTVSNWERGISEPPASDLKALSEALEVSVTILLYSDDQIDSPELAQVL